MSRAATPATNRYLVVWSDERNGPFDPDVWGRFVDSKGNPTGVSGFPIESSTDTQYQPALAHMSDLTSGDYLVVWTDGRGTTNDIWGRIYP